MNEHATVVMSVFIHTYVGQFSFIIYIFDAYITVPSPTASVTALDTQTVGQSLTLQCEVTTVRGITSRVDIVWSSNDTELERMNDVSSTTMDNSLVYILERMNNVSSTTMNNSLVYTDSYTISQLSTTDEDRVIQCEVVINASPPVMASNSTTLDVMGMYITLLDCVLALVSCSMLSSYLDGQHRYP